MKKMFFYLLALLIFLLNASCYYQRHVFHYNILLYDGDDNHILELDRIKEFDVALLRLSEPVTPSNYTYNIYATSWSGTPLYRIVFDIEKFNGRGSLNKYEVWAGKEGKYLSVQIEDKKGKYKPENIYLLENDKDNNLIVKLKRK